MKKNVEVKVGPFLVQGYKKSLDSKESPIAAHRSFMEYTMDRDPRFEVTYVVHGVLVEDDGYSLLTAETVFGSSVYRRRGEPQMSLNKDRGFQIEFSNLPSVLGQQKVLNG